MSGAPYLKANSLQLAMIYVAEQYSNGAKSITVWELLEWKTVKASQPREIEAVEEFLSAKSGASNSIPIKRRYSIAATQMDEFK